MPPMASSAPPCAMSLVCIRRTPSWEASKMNARPKRPIRVLLAKLGMDTHTVGVTVIAHALREAGMEVIFTGLKQTPEMVANAAIQEDVDVVGISTLSAGHTRSLPRLAQILRDKGAGDKLLVAGGVIPEEDQPLLTAA